MQPAYNQSVQRGWFCVEKRRELLKALGKSLQQNVNNGGYIQQMTSEGMGSDRAICSLAAFCPKG